MTYVSFIYDINLSDQSSGNGDLLTTTSIEDSSSSDKTGSYKEKNCISSARCFRVELTPDNIAVAMVYIVQGVLGLSDLAVSFYLKDDYCRGMPSSRGTLLYVVG